MRRKAPLLSYVRAASFPRKREPTVAEKLCKGLQKERAGRPRAPHSFPAQAGRSVTQRPQSDEGSARGASIRIGRPSQWMRDVPAFVQSAITPVGSSW